MAVSNAERQKRYRDQRVAMKAALERIVARLDGNAKPLAVELRDIAQRGLEGKAPE